MLPAGLATRTLHPTPLAASLALSACGPTHPAIFGEQEGSRVRFVGRSTEKAPTPFLLVVVQVVSGWAGVFDAIGFGLRGWLGAWVWPIRGRYCNPQRVGPGVCPRRSTA